MTLSTWVSTAGVKPDVYVKCQGQGCGGVIMFNKAELLTRRSINTNTSTPCKHCGWHPAWPPEPWVELEGATF